MNKETLKNSVTEYICEKRLQRCNQMMLVQLNSISDKSVKRCNMSKFTFTCQSLNLNKILCLSFALLNVTGYLKINCSHTVTSWKFNKHNSYNWAILQTCLLIGYQNTFRKLTSIRHVHRAWGKAKYDDPNTQTLKICLHIYDEN